MNEICKAYTKDGILEIIIQVKVNTFYQVPYNIPKKFFELEMDHFEVFNNWLYINSDLYVPINMDNTLYTKIIKKYRLWYLKSIFASYQTIIVSSIGINDYRWQIHLLNLFRVVIFTICQQTTNVKNLICQNFTSLRPIWDWYLIWCNHNITNFSKRWSKIWI